MSASIVRSHKFSDREVFFIERDAKVISQFFSTRTDAIQAHYSGNFRVPR